MAGKATSSGTQQFLRVPDIHPNSPYCWVSWADWESKVRTPADLDRRIRVPSQVDIPGVAVHYMAVFERHGIR